MMGSAVWDFFQLQNSKMRPMGKTVLHSQTKHRRPHVTAERRAIFSVCAAFEIYEHHATCSMVEYCEHSVDGSVVDSGELTPHQLLTMLHERKENVLLLSVNPAALASWMVDDTFSVVYRCQNPRRPLRVPWKGFKGDEVQVDAPDGIGTHNIFTFYRGDGERMPSKVELWDVGKVTGDVWPLRSEYCYPTMELTSQAVSGYMKAMSDIGLRGEDGDGKLKRTPASQTAAAFLHSFYDRERADEILKAPMKLEDFYMTGRIRYMTPEFMMPEQPVWYPRLYHYDLKSAYLNIMREPMPGKFIRGFNIKQIKELNLTLGELRKRYRGAHRIWVAEVLLEGTCPTTFKSAQVSKWVSNSDIADFVDLYDDSLMPVYVSVWEPKAAMRRFAEHLIAKRAEYSHDKDVALAIKTCSVTAHMGLGYVGNSYLPITPGTQRYQYCENNTVLVNREPNGTILSVKNEATENLNRVKEHGHYVSVYGRYSQVRGQWDYVENVQQSLVDNRAPHVGGWCLLSCSARVLNLVAAANRSGADVVWVHTDGIRTTQPIPVTAMPDWVKREAGLMGVEVETDVCLWPDGSRMLGRELTVKPGTMKTARSGAHIYMLDGRFRPDGRVGWFEASYENVEREKARERDLVLDYELKAAEFGKAKAGEYEPLDKLGAWGHENLDYGRVGLG